MRRLFPVSALVGSAMLVLAGCSSAPADRDASEDVAGLKDNPPAVTLLCSEKQISLKVPDGTTSIRIEAEGAAGSGASSEVDATRGSVGGSVVGTYPYEESDGDELYAKVGCQGKQDGGFPDGGNGIAKADPAGGGGGSTGLYRDKSGGDATDPIIVAGGGGGSSEDGTPGGSPGTDGIGGDGTGPVINGGPSCGGGGGQAKSPGKAKKYGSGLGNPYPGEDGSGQRGGDAPAGDTAGGMGGAGGGGYFGGASGCTADITCSGCLGSGGAGSSYADPTTVSATFTQLTNPSDGSLGLTFLCPDAKAGDLAPCADQPSSAPSS